jgi:predicted PurR-regulated permease PerM
MDSRRTQNDLARVTLGVLSVLALLGTAIWIMLPFVSAILWATMVVITTWPLLEKLQSRLCGRRSLAAAVLTIALLLLLLIPMGIAAGALVSHMDTIVSWTRSLRDFSMPPIPAWVSSLPLLGPKLTEAWQTAATAGP